jgi:maleate cis-trans isomerase
MVAGPTDPLRDSGDDPFALTPEQHHIVALLERLLTPWDTLSIVAVLEQDLGVPVVQAIAARIWEIQRRLHVRQPIKGYGTLLETLPA